MRWSGSIPARSVNLLWVTDKECVKFWLFFSVLDEMFGCVSLDVQTVFLAFIFTYCDLYERTNEFRELAVSSTSPAKDMVQYHR